MTKISYIVNRTRVAHIVNLEITPRKVDIDLANGGSVPVRIAYTLCSNYSPIWEAHVKNTPIKHTDHGVKPCLSCEKVAMKRGLL